MIGMRGKAAKVLCHPPQKVVIDGEVVGSTPVEVEVVPGRAMNALPLIRQAGMGGGWDCCFVGLPFPQICSSGPLSCFIARRSGGAGPSTG